MSSTSKRNVGLTLACYVDQSYSGLEVCFVAVPIEAKHPYYGSGGDLTASANRALLHLSET